MATSVIMPKAGMAMEDGLIVRWLKKAGDPVEKGEIIAEIETDKSAMEIEAEAEGVILAVLHAEGERVPVTEAIAWIGAPGEKPPLELRSPAPSSAKSAVPAEQAVSPSAAAAGKVATTPAARRIALEAGVALSEIRVPASGILRADDVRIHIRSDVTPLASRMAAAAGIDPASLSRGDGGRKRKDDIKAALSRISSAESVQEDRVVPFTSIQRITGERMSRSHSEIPPVTIFTVADATSMLESREQLNSYGAFQISINDLVVRACAKALETNPRANAVIDGGSLVIKGRIHLGVAVATDAGLLVPTLRDANRLSLSEQSRRMRDLADRARLRRLRPEELEGGTFTISNIGMYGITAFTPIINQPQVGILGVGCIEDRLALESSESVVVRKMMHLSFTFDHRALDGVEASSFLKSVREFMEAPLLLLV
jgi:pyruvate dehydrogenase E2 component (dihydrolipoamide acetyltransferase)